MKHALETAQRFRQIIENAEVMLGEQCIKVTVNIGVAVFQNEAGLTLEPLIDLADQALYQSKAGATQ